MGILDWDDGLGSSKKRKGGGMFDLPEGGLFGGGSKENELSRLKKEERTLRAQEKIYKTKQRIGKLKELQAKRDAQKWEERKKMAGEAYGKAKSVWYKIKPKKKSIYD